MTLRPVSKKNSKTLPSDRTNSALKTDSSWDKLSLGNPALQRLKCPWCRRQSYINKFNKPIFYENSINCIQRHRQPTRTKKPWSSSTLCSKYSNVCQTPFNKKKQGQNNFFCKRQQAKPTVFSLKQSTQDWIEIRRNYIIKKFDSFSKNILKMTGKLSRDTVAKITAKIEENLVKNYELSARNINNSAAGMSLSKTNNAYSTARSRTSCNRLLQVASSKIIPNVSCLNTALIPANTKILDNNNCPVNNKSVSMDKVNCISAKEAGSEIHLSCVISASISKGIVSGKRSVGVQECLQRLKSSSMKNYPSKGAFMSQEKPASAEIRTIDDATDNKPENKTASNVSFGDSAFVKKYISYTNGKPASAEEKESHMVTDFSTDNKLCDNMHTGNIVYDINEKPNSGGDSYFSRRYSTKKPIGMIEKNVSINETNYTSTKSKNKPLSANTVTPIQRQSFTVHEKSTHDRISPVSFVEKPWPEVYDQYDKDKFNLKASSQSHLKRKLQVKVTSKINEMKSSSVKNSQLTSSTNVLFIPSKNTDHSTSTNALCKPSKNTLNFSARKKKFLVDRNENLCSQANFSENATGYTVQLVKLKNYQVSKTSRK